jgi:hypothetical protein
VNLRRVARNDAKRPRSALIIVSTFGEIGEILFKR